MVIHTTTGIAAVVARPGVAGAGVVPRMLARLTHRGPDLSASTRRTGTGFELVMGHVGMVADPDDLPAWRPPADTGIGPALVLDGFFTNLDAVSARLRDAGLLHGGVLPGVAGAQSNSMVELALSRWGEAILEFLDGHFAFLHYDASRNRLLLARDALGVRPLYWAACRGGEGVVIASEIGAILASGMVEQEYDAAGIAAYLAYGHSHAPQTIHRHVHAVPAGSWLEISLEGPRFVPSAPAFHWHPPAVVPPLDPNAAIDGLRDALAQAVAGLAVGLPAASTYLPGDVNSAVLAVMASRSLPELRTAFVDLVSEGHEERARVAAATADQLRARHFQMFVDDEWGSGLWMDWLAAADAPCIEGYDTYVVSQAIKDTGAVAAVFPAGGAELLSGNPWFAMTARLIEITAPVRRAPRWLRPPLLQRIVAASSPLHRELVRDACRGDATPTSIALHARRIFHNADLHRLGLDSVVTGLGSCGLPSGVQSTLPVETGDLFADLTRLQCRLSLPNRTLQACDNGAMANSLEVRLPYATRRVVDYLLTLPGNLLSPKPSRSGEAIRKVASGMLPYNLLVRQEPRPRFQFAAWMHGPLRPFTEQCISAVAACPVLDGDAVRATWARIAEECRVGDGGKALALVALGASMRRVQRESNG